MARLNTRPASSDVDSSGDQSTPEQSRRVHSQTSRSPAHSISDKENQVYSASAASAAPKGTSDARNMSTPSTTSGGSNKKRKLADRRNGLPSQAVHCRELEERVDKQFYDPDQDEDERRATRKGIRELAKELNDSRGEYLQANSKGLVKTLEKADQYFKNVKQTSDATIDSRLLVNAADLSYKKTNEMALGDSSTGVDVDDFISKCISFMRQGVEVAHAAERADRSSSTPVATQAQRHRRRRGLEDDEEDDDQLDWAHLGRNACFLYNSRPCLSAFLLGPLSVQKKVRQQTQRRAREARANPADAVRPQELGDEDMERQETANLTVICQEIGGLLERIQSRGEKSFEVEYNSLPDMPEAELHDLMRKHGIADDGQVPLFDFCVNPKSFGQTVENMFYVSFLIKEGTVGLSTDGRGLPTIGKAGIKTVAERQEAPKNQGVFTLDFDLWEHIVESHGITKSWIPHRKEEEYDDGTNARGQADGWYD